MEKTLVCIIAQTRSYEVTWKNFKLNVLDNLNADLALCIGVTENYNYDNPFWKNADYKWKIDEFGDDYAPAFDQIQNEICKHTQTNKKNWRILLDIKDFWLGGIKNYTKRDSSHLSHNPNWKEMRVGSSSILMFYRWQLLKELKQNNLINKYDRFIITRSDFFWPISHPPLKLFNNKYIWIPDGESYGGYTDRYVLLGRKYISKYLSLIEPILNEPDYHFDKMKSKNDWNLEKYLKFYLKIKNLNKKVKMFPYFMYTVFPNPKKTKEFKEYTQLNYRWMKEIYSMTNFLPQITLSLKNQANIFHL